jgi:protein phosphatase
MLDEETVQRLVLETADLEEAARALVEAANRNGGEDNVTVVLFALAEAGEDEDTLSGLEGFRIEPPPPLPESSTTDGAGDTVVRPSPVRSEPSLPPPPPRAGRIALLLAGVIVLFAGVASLALWGLSRAHFVGATESGRLAVYQGVPWDLVGGAKLYRETYVSPLLTAQLSVEERLELFDHDLMSEDAARARITPYEEEATP